MANFLTISNTLARMEAKIDALTPKVPEPKPKKEFKK